MQLRHFLCLAAVATVALVSLLAAPSHAVSGPIQNLNTHYFLLLWSNTYPLNYLWSGNNLCAWEGISCDTVKQQVSMVLPKVGLRGTIPPWGNYYKDFVPSDAQIVSVNLAFNDQLTGAFPAHYGQVTALQELLLLGTGLSGTIPVAWNALTNLAIVDVSQTKACGGLPAWDAVSMPNLQYMHFNSNPYMFGTIPASLSTFGAVSFNTSGCPLCGCLPNEFSSSLYMRYQLTQDVPQVTSASCATMNVCTAAHLSCNVLKGSAASAPVLALTSLLVVLVSLMVTLVL